MSETFDCDRPWNRVLQDLREWRHRAMAAKYAGLPRRNWPVGDTIDINLESLFREVRAFAEREAFDLVNRIT